MERGGRCWIAAAARLSAAAGLLTMTAAPGAGPTYSVGPISPAYSYFTSSIDGGNTWSTPLKVGPQA